VTPYPLPVDRYEPQTNERAVCRPKSVNHYLECAHSTNNLENVRNYEVRSVTHGSTVLHRSTAIRHPHPRAPSSSPTDEQWAKVSKSKVNINMLICCRSQ
jgi:hypothetical protein